MVGVDVLADLEELVSNEHFAGELYPLVERWERSRVGTEALAPIFEFIERNPDLDYGAPGELVRFLERFRERGYEAALLQSLNRKPNTITLSMLNALLDGERDASREMAYLSLMRAIAVDPRVDEPVREDAREFLDWQRRRGLA
jgi:hypothetical protein